MYLALFLAPWILMYAISTMAMNHREWFRPKQGPLQAFEKERELILPAPLPVGATPKDTGRLVLERLGLDGTHNVNASPDGLRLTILRNDPVTPRRITYTPGDGRAVVEKQVFRMPAYLGRMHRRRGYQHPYPLEKSWAFSVDLVIAALLFWTASGLWLWWEMRKTRLAGAVCLVGGAMLFALFVFTI